MFVKVGVCVCQFLYTGMVESKMSNVWLTLLLQHVHFARKQSQIHSRTVADGWAGAVMQKTLAIQ